MKDYVTKLHHPRPALAADIVRTNSYEASRSLTSARRTFSYSLRKVENSRLASGIAPERPATSNWPHIEENDKAPKLELAPLKLWARRWSWSVSPRSIAYWIASSLFGPSSKNVSIISAKKSGSSSACRSLKLAMIRASRTWGSEGCCS